MFSVVWAFYSITTVVFSFSSCSSLVAQTVQLLVNNRTNAAKVENHRCVICSRHMGFPILVENVFMCSTVVVMGPGSSSDRNRVFDYMSTKTIISHRQINKQQNKYTLVTNRCQKPW